jgi:uncharacterized protein YndB with AHSA1/START domain
MSGSNQETRKLEAKVEIAAPAEAVWQALTDTTEVTRWFPLEAGTNPDGTVWIAWARSFVSAAGSKPASHLAT